jgi:hypothetical protein
MFSGPSLVIACLKISEYYPASGSSKTESESEYE